MSWLAYNAVSAGERDGIMVKVMVINVLFLACVLARGGEREGASQWWNVQGPHSPSRTLSVSKLQIYNCPVQRHCMQIMISIITSTLAVCLKAWQSVTVQEWMYSRASSARCIDRKLIECTLLIACEGGGEGLAPIRPYPSVRLSASPGTGS